MRPLAWPWAAPCLSLRRPASVPPTIMGKSHRSGGLRWMLVARSRALGQEDRPAFDHDPVPADILCWAGAARACWADRGPGCREPDHGSGVARRLWAAAAVCVCSRAPGKHGRPVDLLRRRLAPEGISLPRHRSRADPRPDAAAAASAVAAAIGRAWPRARPSGRGTEPLGIEPVRGLRTRRTLSPRRSGRRRGAVCAAERQRCGWSATYRRPAAAAGSSPGCRPRLPAVTLFDRVAVALLPPEPSHRPALPMPPAEAAGRALDALLLP